VGGRLERTVEVDSSSDYPIWGPEGRRLLFSAASTRFTDIFVLDLDSNEQPRRLTDSPHWHSANDWSRDGRRVVFTERRRDDQHDIYLLDLSDDDPAPAPFATSTDNEAMARFSPDGRWIAFAKDVAGTPQIFVAPSQREGERAPERQVSRRGGWGPVWSPAGDKLYYIIVDGSGLLSVPVTTTGAQSVSFGPEQPVLTDLRLPGVDWLGGDRAYDIHPDGDRFLMLLEREIESMSLVVVENWLDELKRLGPRPRP
jgi:Tol biopolymer transport system component